MRRRRARGLGDCRPSVSGLEGGQEEGRCATRPAHSGRNNRRVRCLRPQDRLGTLSFSSGEEIVGTLTGRSRRVLAGYLAKLGVEVAAGAPIFRNRSSRPYSKDTLGGDFRDIRAMVFGEGERRTIADMRRSGTIEAKRRGATKEAIGEKLGNAFATSKFINDTYGSTVVQIVREVDDARRRARTKERAG